MAIKRMTQVRYDQIPNVCRELEAKNVVILNFETIRSDQMQRSLRFLSGYCAATGAGLQLISGANYLLTPSDMKPQFRDPEMFGKKPEILILRSEDDGDIAERCANLVGAGISVIYNCENTSQERAQEDIDYLSGFCYGVQASIHTMSAKLFLLSPEGVEVDF